MVRRIVVAGASLAGLRAAEALRAQGFDGRLTLIGDEADPPYDRPPLSKQVLQGSWEPERAFLRRHEGYDSLALDMRLGVRAASLDVRSRRLVLGNGDTLEYDRAILTTGARARTMPGVAPREGLHVLRSLADAVALARELATARRVAVVGGGFIGLEVAASCRLRGLDVTVVEQAPLPLSSICGDAAGHVVSTMHRDHGVDLRTGVAVAAVEGTPRATGLRLSDGAFVRADVIVVGIGVTPNTEWVEGSGLTVGNGIVCDGTGAAAPDVYAAGDVARMYNAWIGAAVRIEHWTNAVEQAAHVARSVLAGAGAAEFSSVPYFWSDQYDRKIQFIGDARGHDEMLVVDGSVTERRFTALFRRDARLCACLAMNQPRAVVRYRKLLASNVSWDIALQP